MGRFFIVHFYFLTREGEREKKKEIGAINFPIQKVESAYIFFSLSSGLYVVNYNIVFFFKMYKKIPAGINH